MQELNEVRLEVLLQGDRLSFLSCNKRQFPNTDLSVDVFEVRLPRETNKDTQSPTKGRVLIPALLSGSMGLKSLECYSATSLPVWFDGAVDSNGRVAGKRTRVCR